MKLVIILILISTHSYSQWMAGEQVEKNNVHAWVPKLTVEYQGVYHFGDSENESQLLLFFSGDKFIAQIRSGSWSDDGESWIWKYENLKDVKIEGNKFFSNKTNGQFVIYDNGTERLKGLQVFNPWSLITNIGQWEIGLREGSPEEFLPGKFPQASLRLLDKNYLLQFNKSELIIMRNEIFARYGFKFKTDGKMDRYFKKEKWYHRQHDNVDKFLTDTERINIRTIQEVENR